MLNYLVKKAKHIKDYKVWFSFADGKSGEVDIKKVIKKFDGVFEPLQDINYFKDFKIKGSTIAWKNKADIAPESLYELLIKQKNNTNKK